SPAGTPRRRVNCFAVGACRSIVRRERNPLPAPARELPPLPSRRMIPLLFVGSALYLPAAPPDYARDIKPLFAKHCVGCHGPDKQRSSLRLDSAAGLRKGGNSGPAIVSGDSDHSLLLKAVTGADKVAVMPPKGPRLEASEVAVLRAWIDAGAPAP